VANRIGVGQGIGQVLAASPVRASRRAGLSRRPSRPSSRGVCCSGRWSMDGRTGRWSDPRASALNNEGPESFKIGRRRVWMRSTVEAWLAQQKAER